MLRTVGFMPNLNIRTYVSSIAFRGVSEDDLEKGRSAIEYAQNLGIKSGTKMMLEVFNKTQAGDFPTEKEIVEAGRIESLIERLLDERPVGVAISEEDILAMEERVGNCPEFADIAYNQLVPKFNAGEVDRVCFDLIRRFHPAISGHEFVVTKLAKEVPDFDIANPDTWGEEAMIVDAWSGENGIVGPVKESLDEMLEPLKLEKQDIEFKYPKRHTP